MRTVPLLLNAALAFAEQGDLDNVLRTLSHLPTSEDITQTHNARLLFDIYMALLKNGRLDALEQFAGYLGLTSEMRLSGGLNGAYINRHLVALRESGNTPAIAQLLQIAPLEFLGLALHLFISSQKLTGLFLTRICFCKWALAQYPVVSY